MKSLSSRSGTKRPWNRYAAPLHAPLTIVILLIAAFVGPRSVQAQGTFRVVVSGVPPVLSTPVIGELERNLRQGRYMTQVIYSNPNGEPVNVRFQATLRYQGEQVAETVSRPVKYDPGTYVYRTFEETPEVTFEESTQDIIDQLSDRLRENVTRAGILPEGEYAIEVRPVLVNAFRSITPISGRARTIVRYPQPPTLISPADGATVTAGMPVFSWTPVNATTGDIFEYNLILVRVRPGQTPLQAIEANRPVTGREPVSVRQTSFSYTRSLPPLDEGALYAWQVRAAEVTNRVPLSEDGESPIRTFTYRGGRPQVRAPELISPSPGSRVPRIDALEFEWQTAADGPATDPPAPFTRVIQRLVVAERTDDQDAGTAVSEGDRVVEKTYAFSPDQRQTDAGLSDSLAQGSYAWAVQIVGETSEGRTETLAQSPAAPFTVGEEEPSPPVATSGAIQLTPYAALAGTDTLQRTKNVYSGQASLHLDLDGQDQPIRVPARAKKVRVTPGAGNIWVAEEGRVRSTTAGSALRVDEIQGLRLDRLRWRGAADLLAADASLTLNAPFTCGKTTVDLPERALALQSDGVVAGSTSVEIDCPVQVGPYKATPTRTTLVFGRGETGQTAYLESKATLAVSSDVKAKGRFTLDLTTGEFEQLEFVVDEPFEWGIPKNDPALTFRVRRARIGLDGMRINGRNQLLLPGGSRVRATFDSLHVGFREGEIRSGQIIFDTGFGVEAGMDPDGSDLTYRAVSANSELGTQPGVLVTLTDTTILDRTGLHSSGTGTAQLSFADWSPADSLLADFSSRFALGVRPFGIQGGQVDLVHRDASIGYVDRYGFHPNPAYVTAQIPKRLPLPTEQVAYLRLWKNGSPVVSLSQQSGGTGVLTPKSGSSPDLVIPAVNDTVTVSAQTTNLTVSTRGGFSYRSGTVSGTVSGNGIDLTSDGVPLYLTTATYTQAQVNGQSRTGLFLHGNLALFGENTGSSGAVTLAMDQQGGVSGAVDLAGMGTEIDVAGGGKVALTVDTLNGQVTTPPNGTPSYDFSLGGTIALRDTGTTFASATLGLNVTDQGLTVQQFSSTSNRQTPPLSSGGVELDVGGITSLDKLTYSEQNGFGFRVGLDLDLQLPGPNGGTFAVPLKGVEVFRDRETRNGGFILPTQTLHKNTTPALDVQQTVTVGPVDLRLINADLTRDVTFDWFDGAQNLGQSLSAVELDLGVNVNGYPSLSGTEFSVYNAGIQDGVLTGQVKTYSYLNGQEPTVYVGGTTGITVDSISGALTRSGPAQNPSQEVDIDLNGWVDLPNVFASNGPTNCPPMEVTANLTDGGGLSATVSNFAACGGVAFGPATLTFPSSTLTLAYQNGTQTAILDGTANATLQGVNQTLSASGTAKYDLIAGTLRSSSLIFSGAFDYGLPQPDTLFAFRVQQASLTSAGLSFTGTGSLRTEQDQQVATVAFNQLTVHPDSSIVSGSATLQSQFGLEADLGSGQVDWSVIQASAPTPQNPALRMTLPASLTLDKHGLTISGSSTATLYFSGNAYSSLTADFKPVRIGLEPVDVDSGRVDFTTQGGTRVAYYDAGGFEFDAGGIAVASVPAKLGLPTKQVAYLKLRDAQGNPLIDYESASGGGYEVSSATDSQGNLKPIQLVLASVESQGTSPTFSLTIPDSDPLVVDGAFQKITSGTLSLSVDEPLRTTYDLPLHLETLTYEKDPSGTYAVTADGSVDLPEGLGGEQVSFSDLGFGSDGPQGTIAAGTYTGGTTATGTCSDVSSSTSASVLASAAYKNGTIKPNLSGQQLENADLAVRLRGVKFSFGGGSHSFSVQGDATSRLLQDPSGSDKVPDSLAFAGGYSGGSWSANLCTNQLPTDSNGDQKVSLQVADLYLDDNVGAGIGLEVGPNTMNLLLSGTARFPDVLGGSFEATVQELKTGTAGIRVGKAQAATGGQSFRLFGGELKVETDAPPQGFSVNWDTKNRELVLSMSGDLWLTAFMDPTKPADAAQFNNLTVSTGGDVSLGSASANLLANRTLAAIGSSPDPAMSVDTLRLEKSPRAAALALTVGGSVHLPDLMDGVTSDYSLTVDSDGKISSSSPLRAQFVTPSGKNDSVDKIGDNPSTEVDFGDVATMDVKEVGVSFVNSQIGQPAIYANGAAYVQPDGNTVDDLVRFGSLGSDNASSAGLYYRVNKTPSFNATAHVDNFDLFGFLTLSNMNVSVKTVGGTQKVVLGGDVGVNLKNAGGASARWEDLKISKQGIAQGDMGHLAGNLSITLVDVVTLSLNSLNYGEGRFTYQPPDGGADSTITADKYFKLTGASLKLSEVGSGGIDAAYYYVTGGGANTALEIYGASVSFKDVASGNASMVYEKREGSVKLFAAGYVKFAGNQRVTLSGAYESTNGNLRYGLFASWKGKGGIPVAPGVTLTGIGGGFFHRPRGDWLKEVRKNALTNSRQLLPKTPKWKNSSLTFAAYVYGQGTVGGGVDVGVLLEATSNKTSVYGVGNVKGIPQKLMGAGLRLSVYYGQREGVDGGVKLNITYPTVLNGKAKVNFAAYVNQRGNTPPVHWFVKGKLGTGSQDVRIMTIYQASGTFLASNEGMLLKKLHVGLGTPKLGVIDINAGATVSYWHVPQEALGAYAKIGVNAKLFGGAAKLGANLKGAYIREEKLIYAAADAYVKVIGVFKGNVGLWAAIEKGNVKGGKGSNDRYDQMVKNARSQAQNMIAEAKKAAKRMEKLKQKPARASDKALAEAGVNAIDPESAVNGRSVLSGLKGAESRVLSRGGVNRLTYGLDHVVKARDKPSPSAANNAFQRATSKRKTANNRVGAVTSHVQSLTQKQITWTNEAQKKLKQLTTGSPVGSVQSAQYTGSGDKRRVTRSPTWTVDQQKAKQQSKDLAELKKSIDRLNEQYKKSLSAVAANVEQANQMFEATVQAGSGQTSINELAGTYADAAEKTRKYYAERADYLWDLGGWAAAKRATIQGKKGSILQARTSYKQSKMTQSFQRKLKRMALTRYSSLKNLVKKHKKGLPDKQKVQSDLSNAPISTYKSWGKQVWYDVFEEGLKAMEDSSEKNAKALHSDLYASVGTEAYQQFTRQVGDAYVAKHQLLTTYYGMVEAYRGWRRDMGLQTLVSRPSSSSGGGSGQSQKFVVGRYYVQYDQVLTDRLDSLESVLEPPQINGVTVNRSHEGWKADADVNVSVSHPEGLAELSYDVSRGTSSDVYGAGPFYSIGDRTSFKLYAFAERRNQKTQDFTLAIRARGPGGSTLTRRANFTLAVTKAGENSAPNGQVAAMEKDTSPPVGPLVVFPSAQYHEGTEKVQRHVGATGKRHKNQQQGGGKNTVSITALQGQNTTNAQATIQVEAKRYWTGASTKLTFKATAADDESDIAGFDYKLGTSKGGDEVRDWTPAQGRSLTRSILGAGANANMNIQAAVRGLTLEEGTPYYLSVRARNGAGLTATEERDAGIVYDGTGPTKPGLSSDPYDEGPTPSPGYFFGVMQRPVMDPPRWKGMPSNVGDPIPPSVKLRWKATSKDKESGVWQYIYVPTTDPSAVPTDVFTESERVYGSKGSSGTITGGRLSYVDSVWVHLRAIDHVQNRSEPITIGPFLPTDPSLPVAPEVHPVVVEDGVRLYVARPAYDQETGIKGYQYKIENRRSGTTLKSFPSGSTTDFGPLCPASSMNLVGAMVLEVDAGGKWTPDAHPMGCVPEKGVTEAPYHFISNDQLPIGVPLNIELKAVNGQGMVRAAGTLGPIVADTTSPSFGAKASSGSSSSTVEVTVNNAQDPETGIAKVEYYSSGYGWTDVASHQNPPTSPKSYSFVARGMSRLNVNNQGRESVIVRVTNGVGQETVRRILVSQSASAGTRQVNWGNSSLGL